jgi:hypothetical protein
MAKSEGGLGTRLDAIDLLREMPTDFRIETGLRPLLDSSDLEVRLRVIETLAKRNDAVLRKFAVNKKFDLILVPSKHNLVYVTQTGWPQIILTGDIQIERPLTLSIWDNNLLVKESPDQDPKDSRTNLLEVRYKDDEHNITFNEKIESDLPTFIMFLAHQKTPEHPAPGLNLPYSRTIGALHALWREQYLNADFKVEQDRLLAAIQRLATETSYTERPDFAKPVESTPNSRFIESSDPVTIEEHE